MISTRATIAAGLRDFGVGGTVLVHTSMRSLGLVIGGARAVVEALLETCDTVMMPAFSGDISDPCEWRHPPVDNPMAIRAEILRFDPLLTPTRGIGIVPEYFRHWPGAVRSTHPQSSFSAVGPAAAWLMSIHAHEHRFGRFSPLGRLMKIGGKTLLLGAPHNTATALYLAQRDPVVSRRMLDGSVCRDVDYCDTSVDPLIAAGIARTGEVSGAPAVLFDVAEAVEYLAGRQTRAA